MTEDVVPYRVAPSVAAQDDAGVVSAPKPAPDYEGLLRALVAALRELESGPRMLCRICRWYHDPKRAPNCPLDAAERALS